MRPWGSNSSDRWASAHSSTHGLGSCDPWPRAGLKAHPLGARFFAREQCHMWEGCLEDALPPPSGSPAGELHIRVTVTCRSACPLLSFFPHLSFPTPLCPSWDPLSDKLPGPKSLCISLLSVTVTKCLTKSTYKEERLV